MQCSKYLTILNSNTLYCGKSLLPSSVTKDVSKLFAVPGSAANPVKTLEQVIEILTTEFATVPTVEIQFTAGSYGEENAVYKWPSNASVLRGAGSPVTFFQGNHRCIGITFTGGLPEQPVFSLVQEGISPWNVVQEDVVIRGSTLQDIPLIRRTVLSGELKVLWTRGNWKWHRLVRDRYNVRLEGNRGKRGRKCGFGRRYGGRCRESQWRYDSPYTRPTYHHGRSFCLKYILGGHSNPNHVVYVENRRWS